MNANRQLTRDVLVHDCDGQRHRVLVHRLRADLGRRADADGAGDERRHGQRHGVVASLVQLHLDVDGREILNIARSDDIIKRIPIKESIDDLQMKRVHVRSSRIICYLLFFGS